jgi:RsiW-degrading membrane proteinase PrsW (M82 family)
MIETWILASIGGILPALLWLMFWLREDAKHPEPKFRIAMAFLGGMIAVILVLPLEIYTARSMAVTNTNTVLLWAFFEEAFKFFACIFAALRFKENDEPIDAVIYMLTAALGFSAMENTLFLLNPILHGQILQSITTGNLRFMGASLLHVVSSSTLGIFIALSFYKNKMWKFVYAALGVISATGLHTIFNLFIMNGTNETALRTFSIVWLAIIVLMLLFEKVKTLYPHQKNHA